MGTPDAEMEMSGKTVYLDLKTVVVPTKIRPLRTLRYYYSSLPRKRKKAFKKFHGEYFEKMINSRISLSRELISDIYMYHNLDIEKELSEFLIDAIKHEQNKTN